MINRGILDIETGITVYRYVYPREKTFQEFKDSRYIQYIITEGTDPRAYSWDGSEVIFDPAWVDTSLIRREVIYKVNKARSFASNLIEDFAVDNVLMGITQLGKTADVLSVMTEKVVTAGSTRPVSIMDAVHSGSLYELMDLIDYHINNISEYSDLEPFITQERLEAFKLKIQVWLGIV